MELDNAAPAKDVYVSVRVGDVQKFSKLSSKRGYKFPPSVLGNRYGRVELFRRVGTCSVAVDQSASKHVQQVAFPSVDGNTGTSIRVEVAPQEAAESSHEKKKGPNPKFASAREYLEKHQMELRLAEAMQALLRERPDDPGAFVAAALQQSKDMVKVTAKEVPGKTTAEVAKSFDVVPFSRYYSVCFRSFPQEYWAQLGDSFRTRQNQRPWYPFLRTTSHMSVPVQMDRGQRSTASSIRRPPSRHHLSRARRLRREHAVCTSTLHHLFRQQRRCSNHVRGLSRSTTDCICPPRHRCGTASTQDLCSTTKWTQQFSRTRRLHLFRRHSLCRHQCLSLNTTARMFR